MTLLSCNHLIIFAFLGNLLSFFISWNVHFKWSEKEFIQFILNTVSWCIYLTSQSKRNKFVVVVVVLNFQRVFRLWMRDCCIINSNASIAIWSTYHIWKMALHDYCVTIGNLKNPILPHFWRKKSSFSLVSLHFELGLQSPVCILHLVCIL